MKFQEAPPIHAGTFGVGFCKDVKELLGGDRFDGERTGGEKTLVVGVVVVVVDHGALVVLAIVYVFEVVIWLWL